MNSVDMAHNSMSKTNMILHKLRLSKSELRTYGAEAVGVFMLSMVVLFVSQSTLGILTPLLGGLTLGLLVYVLGPVSGGHFNPAVTLGVLSLDRISLRSAIGYIISQFVGALGALALIAYFANKQFTLVQSMKGPGMQAITPMVFVAELLGTLIFTFAIASVVYGKTHQNVSGLVIGTGLLIGSFTALFAGSFGILNPAVAFSAGTLNLLTGLAPIVGALIGMNLYKILKAE